MVLSKIYINSDILITSLLLFFSYINIRRVVNMFYRYKRQLFLIIIDNLKIF